MDNWDYEPPGWGGLFVLAAAIVFVAWLALCVTG